MFLQKFLTIAIKHAIIDLVFKQIIYIYNLNYDGNG